MENDHWGGFSSFRLAAVEEVTVELRVIRERAEDVFREMGGIMPG